MDEKKKIIEEVVDRIASFQGEQMKDFIYLLEELCSSSINEEAINEIKQTLVEMVYPECLGDIVYLQDKEETNKDEKFTMFWDGPFSQWYPSVFVVGGITYNCCEQYMMSYKAKFFGDVETYKQIMATSSPKEQKRLGREVLYFDIDKWNKIAKDVVKEGNIAKFSQNPFLLGQLMATKGTTLVEASPRDNLWGIGLSEGDPLSLKRETWKGKNWLGEVLTEVREILSKKYK